MLLNITDLKKWLGYERTADVVGRRLKLPRGEWQEVEAGNLSAPQGMTRAYINNRFVVMVFDNEQFPLCPVRAIKVMVQRHDDKPIPNHWREMQRIKNELFGFEMWAVECYPAEPELIDDANIYWLWIPFFGCPPRHQESKNGKCND